MTECTKQLVFPFFKPARLTAAFTGGSLTSDAGLLLVREFDERIGFSKRFASLIPDPRDERFVSHDQLTLVRQRLYQIVAGYEDANDSSLLRRDPVLKAITGRCPEDLDLGSQPTFSRLENRASAGASEDLVEEMTRCFIRTRPAPLSEITLDIDPSEARTYGQQELAFYSGHYNGYPDDPNQADQSRRSHRTNGPKALDQAQLHLALCRILRASLQGDTGSSVRVILPVHGRSRTEILCSNIVIGASFIQSAARAGTPSVFEVVFRGRAAAIRPRIPEAALLPV